MALTSSIFLAGIVTVSALGPEDTEAPIQHRPPLDCLAPCLAQRYAQHHPPYEDEDCFPQCHVPHCADDRVIYVQLAESGLWPGHRVLKVPPLGPKVWVLW
eukprot:6492526-Amphidinium_carterae.3